MAVGSGAPPAKPRAPAWAAVFSETPGVVNLARAVTHQHNGELNTMARVSIFAGGRFGSGRVSLLSGRI
jgi:hypothetical protein